MKAQSLATEFHVCFWVLANWAENEGIEELVQGIEKLADIVVTIEDNLFLLLSPLGLNGESITEPLAKSAWGTVDCLCNSLWIQNCGFDTIT